MRALMREDANQDARMLTSRKKSLPSEPGMKLGQITMIKPTAGSPSSSLLGATALSLTILLYLTAALHQMVLVQASTLGRLGSRDVDPMIPAEARLRIVTNAKPVIESASNSAASLLSSDKADDESPQGSLSLRDRLAKLRESLQRRDRLKDLHESFKERIGGIRGARSTGDKVYKLNINLPVTKKGPQDDYSGAESKTRPTTKASDAPMMALTQPQVKVVEQKVDASSGGTNRLVNYDDSLQDGESIRKRFFAPLVDNDGSLVQPAGGAGGGNPFGNPPFEHLASNLADSLFGYYPSSRGQRTARSVSMGAGLGNPYESLGSSPMVSHEPPNFQLAMSQDAIPLSLGMSNNHQPPPSQPSLQIEQPTMQRIDDGLLAKSGQQQQQQQQQAQSDQLSSDTIWPTPTGEPFGFTAHTPANNFGQRASSSSKMNSNQRMQELGEGRETMPSAARLDRFVMGQELSSGSLSKESTGLEQHNHGEKPASSPATSSDPMRMASEEEYSMKSNMGDYDEGHSTGGMHEEAAYKKAPKKIDRHYEEEESHETYEAHVPKKVIIKKEEKHHHHHHHHHHHEPEKKEEHKKHEKVHVQTQPLHLEIHIKGKSKSKIKSKGKGKGKDKSKGKNKDGDEIYVKLNQGGGHGGGHHGEHHHHGGHHMDGGDDGSYVEENSSGRNVIEDKKSLLEEEPSSAGGDDGGSNDGAAPIKSQAMNTVAAADNGGASDSEQKESAEGGDAETEQQSNESKSTKDVDQEPRFDANHVINTSEVPKYFDIFGEDLHSKDHGKSSEEKKENHKGEEKAAKESKDEAGEQKAVAENQENEGGGEESKEVNEESHQHKKHKKPEKKKKNKKEKKGKKKEVVKEDKKEHVEEHHKEEKKEEPKHEEPAKKEVEQQKHEEPVKKEEEKKKDHHHKAKHAHIEVHKHNHFEHHEHINLAQHKPELEHHQPEMEHHPEIEHQPHQELHHEHLGEHQEHGHHEMEGLHPHHHHEEHHGGYGAPMMHHHEPEHHQPIKEHWVAPMIHEKPSNEHHPHGAFVIEDHSELEKHNIQHPEYYKEEIINHPHGFGLTPVAAFNLMSAYSHQSPTTESDKSKSGSDNMETTQKQPTTEAAREGTKKVAPEKTPTRH